MNAPQQSLPCAVAEYRAAREDAVFADRSDLGRLFFYGKDALDLLHRLTTNDLLSLHPGQGKATALVTAKGRLIDLLLLHRLEDRLFGVSGPGRSGAICDYIDRFTFREDMRVEDASRSYGTLGIFGPRAAERVRLLAGGEAALLPLHHVTAIDVAGVPVLLTRTYPLGGDGFHLSAPTAARPALLAAVRGRGALAEAGPACLDLLRIEAGQPAAGRELTEDYNPWEAGLDDAISLNKGCYVGQEVIARLNTYKKVSKRLVRIQVTGGLPSTGARLTNPAGETIGILTSAARPPEEDRVVALGYVRDELALAGGEIGVVDDSRRLAARILGLAR